MPLVKRYALAMFCFLSAMYFASRPSGLGQLLLMLASVALFVAILRLAWATITCWRHKKASTLIAPALIVAGFGMGIFLGGVFREWNFKHSLATYDRAVAWASTQAKSDETVALELPGEFSHLGRLVHVRKSATCGLMVDFFWGGGFPVKHIVRRFAERSDVMDLPECRRSWSHGRQLADNWYELRD